MLRTAVILLSIFLGCAAASDFDKAFHAYNKKEFSKAIDLWQRSCDEGEYRSCNILALMYDNGENVVQNRTKAKKMYRKACMGGDTVGCKFYQRLEQMGY